MRKYLRNHPTHAQRQQATGRPYTKTEFRRVRARMDESFCVVGEPRPSVSAVHIQCRGEYVM